VSETAKGAEIANLLIHLTDPGQNTLFQDKYLGNINLDISKSIFVFSFNDITKVHPVLLDRMNLIYVNGYNPAEKLVITRDYLLPELLETYKLFLEPGNEIKQPAVAFTNENLEYIINYDASNKQNSTEQGVRQIKRRLEKICSQLNIIKLVSNNWTNSIHSILDKLPELQQQGLNMTSPLTLSNATLDILLSANTAGSGSTSYLSSMYT
jgi:ATP-dependent Lon protease